MIYDSISNARNKIKEKKISIFIGWMCFLAALFYCYEYYLRVAPSVMHAELMQAFTLSDGELGIMVAYYYYAYVPLQVPVGVMMDRYGPRKILTFACFLCAIGTLIFASTYVTFFAKLGRFLIGFGSAFAYVGVLKIADLWLPGKFFALIAGIATALGMVGAMSGEIVMAYMVQAYGWRQTLYHAASYGIILSFILLLFIRDRNQPKHNSFDYTLHKNESLWNQLLVVIRVNELWINGAVGCLAFLPLTVFAEMWAVPFFEKNSLSIHQSAIGSSMIFLGFGVGGPIWGAISDWYQNRKVPLFIGTSSASLSSVVIIFFTPSHLIAIYLLAFLCGFFSSAQILVFAIAKDYARNDLTATTISFTNMLIMLGGIILQPSVGMLLEMLRSIQLKVDDVIVSKDSLVHYHYALIILPLGLVIASILSLMLKPKKP